MSVCNRPWCEQVEPGQASSTGRVDETVLSKLRTVRTFLHDLLYTKCEKLDALLKLFADLPTFELDAVVDAMDSLQPLLDSLVQLLAHDQTEVAPTKLKSLLQEDATYVLQLDQTASAHSMSVHDILWLEHKGLSRQMRKSLSELLDFQSTLVLSPVVGTPDREKEKTNFIELLNWTQLLAETVLALNQIGHFEYETFYHRIPLSQSPESVRLQTKSAEQQLSDWQQVLGTTRDTHYYLNFFPMSFISRLANLLACNQATDEALRTYVWLVSPEAVDDTSCAEFGHLLRAEWKKYPSASSADSVTRLGMIADTLSVACNHLKLRQRPVQSQVPITFPSSGVAMICCAPGEVLEHVLSAYTR